VVQRHVFYLGEINSSQQAAWRKSIEVMEGAENRRRTVALFPEDRYPELDDKEVVRVRLNELELRRPRQWGACWLARIIPSRSLARKIYSTLPNQGAVVDSVNGPWMMRAKHRPGLSKSASQTSGF